MKITAIIEARMTSSRLPGKVLMKVDNKSFLQILVERLRKVSLIDDIVLATTINNSDDILIEHCNELDIKYFRGSEDDVMLRVLNAANEYNSELIVGITADCPFIDPMIIDQIIKIYLNNNADYVSNCVVRSYPDGMDVQVYRKEILEKSESMTINRLDREHVTLHIRNNAHLFSQINVICPENIYWPELGVTLDEQKDFVFLTEIYKILYPKDNFFSCLDIVNCIKQNPWLLEINNSVVRKGDS